MPRQIAGHTQQRATMKMSAYPEAVLTVKIRRYMTQTSEQPARRSKSSQ
jgi:hypothetical protein